MLTCHEEEHMRKRMMWPDLQEVIQLIPAIKYQLPCDLVESPLTDQLLLVDCIVLNLVTVVVLIAHVVELFYRRWPGWLPQTIRQHT